EADEGEEGERDEVEAGDDDDPLEEQRQERDEADGERDREVVPLRRKADAAGTDVGERPDRGSHGRDQRPDEDVRELDEHQRYGRRAEAERERRPEARAVEAQRLGDELSDGA